MNVWTNIQLIFNNREIALLFWITLTIFFVLLSRQRKTLVSIVKILARRFRDTAWHVNMQGISQGRAEHCMFIKMAVEKGFELSSKGPYNLQQGFERS